MTRYRTAEVLREDRDSHKEQGVVEARLEQYGVTAKQLIALRRKVEMTQAMA